MSFAEQKGKVVHLNDSMCNESVFDTFFKNQAKTLRNYLYYKFGDLEAADDVVQEAFVKIWDNCAKIPFEKAKSYLYTVATNMSTSIKRHDKVKLNYASGVVSSGSDASHESPEFLMIENEFKDKLNSAIDGLPDRQREVFLLNRIEKKTYKEIAELSGVSVKAIEKLMHKALLKIRKEMDNENL